MLPLGALVEDDVPVPGAAVGIPLAMMNRHGLVAGATGTGKTSTLQVLAEQLSAAGVPVFVADIKGDLVRAGVARRRRARSCWPARREPRAGLGGHRVTRSSSSRLGGIGKGVPVRATVTDFGPLLLSKVLGLNDTQESSLGLVFHYADTHGLALLDLKDLRAMLAYLISDEGKAELKGLGGLSTATAGVILRELVAFEEQGADVFFGEPAFDAAELLRTAPTAAASSARSSCPPCRTGPRCSRRSSCGCSPSCSRTLPEVGDLDKPKLVFFFDEAHLLFTDASKDFLTQVTQTVRLIRSKGVGVFFVTQSPEGRARRRPGPAGQPRAARAARLHPRRREGAAGDGVAPSRRRATTSSELLKSLGTGEAIVTVLTERGAPTPVAWTRLRAPQSLDGADARPRPCRRRSRRLRSPREVRRGDRPRVGVRAAARRVPPPPRRRRPRRRRRARRRNGPTTRPRRRSGARRSGPTSRTSPLDSLLRSAGTQLGVRSRAPSSAPAGADLRVSAGTNVVDVTMSLSSASVAGRGPPDREASKTMR